MQVRVLGPVDVVGDDGTNVAIGGPIPTRLIAILVASGADGIAIDDLVEHLWVGLTPPADPVASIRTYVARLRASIGPVAIRTGSGRYQLDPMVASDAGLFQDLVERARRASGSPHVADLWQKAVELWRGPAFGDHGDLEPTQVEASRLEEMRAEATEAWFDARLAAGEGRELAADVETAVGQFPLREGFRAQQMTVLARAGRQADALRAYQDFRGDLTEVGLEPSERLIELEGQIAVGDVPRSGARRTLRGYQLGDRLGEGAFAIVHEATQASVGRPVAIKQIRSSLADQPEFIRQFEAEAHLVARLEHPHIVPLYDYWREPGSAYLVMRYLDGGSLHDRLAQGAVSLNQLAALIGQVSAGLDTAHGAGVIHRDVKPANILLDTDGNAYLSDFGIAVEEQERLDPEAWLSNGSPAYAPPEQLRREPVGPPADIYALGVTTYEALTGLLPFPGETTMAGLLERQLNDPVPLVRTSHPDIPAAIDTVIQKATAKSANDRYQTAGAFARDLAAAAGLEGDAQLIEPEDRNPYKGLQAFDEADANDFAGRDRLVAKLLEAVGDHRVTVVVGPSGSGKSSVVRAGLLPALRSQSSSAGWFVSTMVPGSSPFDDLEAALLRVAVDPPADLAADIAQDPDGLSRVLRRILPSGQTLLLLIDQFEELFTLGQADETRQLLDSLVAAATAEDAPLRVVLTIRADFYDQPLRHPAFARLIEESTVAVHPLEADELERAITEPARSVGAGFESGLVAAVAADVSDQPGALPLLQYALTELYDRRVDETMTHAAYEQLGGVTGALARRAEEVFTGLDAEQQQVAQQALTRLVTLGDGTEDTRRRVLRRELGVSAGISVVLERFGSARLLAFDRDPASREPTVEVAHEALIREWPRFRRWLDDDRDGLRIHRHLTEASEEWDRGGRSNSELYRGGRLEAANEFAQRTPEALNATESAFLSASTDRELAEAEAERLSNRRLRRLLVGVAIVAAMALIAGAVAFQQRGAANRSAEEATRNAERAEEQTDLAQRNAGLAEDNAATAETRRLIADAANLTEENYDIALLLAAEAYNRNPSPSGLAGLQRVLTQSGNFLGRLGAGNSYRGVAWTDDALVGYTDTELHWFDEDTGQIRNTLRLPSQPRVRFDGAPVQGIDGDRLAIGLESGLIVVDLADATMSILTHGVPVTGVAVDGQRNLVAIGDTNKALTLIDVESGTTKWQLEGEFPEQSFNDIGFPQAFKESSLWPLVTSDVYTDLLFERGIPGVTFDQAGDVIASSGGMVRRFDIESGLLTAETALQGQVGDEPVPGTGIWLDVLSNGDIIASSGTHQNRLSPDLLQTDYRRFDRGREGPGKSAIHTVVFDDLSVTALLDDGQLTTGFENDESSPQMPLIDTAATNPTHLAINPGGLVAAVSTLDGIVLSALEGDQLLGRAVPRLGHERAEISHDGTRMVVVSFGSGRSPNFYDLETIPPTLIEVPEVRPRADEAFFPVGSSRVVYGDVYTGAVLLDGFNLTELIELPSHELGDAMSPQGDLFVLGRGLGRTDRIELVFFDMERLQNVGSIDLTSHTDPKADFAVRMSAFSVDGRKLVSVTESGRAITIDPETQTVVDVRIPDETGQDSMVAIAFSPNGDLAATRSLSGEIHIRDSETLDILWTLEGGTSAAEDLSLGPYFSPDGRYLLTTRGQLPRLWDLETRTDIGTFPSETTIPIGMPGIDQLYLVTGIGDNTLIWNLDTDTWSDIACRAAGRNLTPEEWEQFGPTDEDYRVTCPQWPALG